ncbi:MAG: hypothetical protein ACLPKT_14180, partial [Methylocella sp.]
EAKELPELLDSVFVMESAMRHFYIRAQINKKNNTEPEKVDADLHAAVAIAKEIAPYRHVDCKR